MDFESAFEKIGLSRQEALVYLSALKIGNGKASEIAKKAGVKREAAYYILKTLQEKGFISEVIKSGVKYYSAVEPKRIFGIIEEDMQRKTEAIAEVFSELEDLQNIALSHPKVEVYEGAEGFKTAVSKLISKKGQTILGYGPEKILHFLPFFHPQFRLKRKENKVKLKFITEQKGEMVERRKHDKEELREIRFNDELMKGIDSAYYVMENAVLIVKANEKEQVGVYVEEEGSARLQKKLFEVVWKQSK